MASAFSRIKFYRAGGAVKRYHVWPIIGEQTVGHHTFGVLTILFELTQNPSMKLIKAALQHDVAEFFTGDTPKNAKWDSPELDKALELLEAATMKKQGVSPYYLTLDEKDKEHLVWADMLELLFFCSEQMNIGNKPIKTIFTRGCKYLRSLPPHPVGSAILDRLEIGIT